MTDTLTPERRSALMSRIQGGFRRNRLEMAVHNWLKGHHVRHRMNPKAPGNPDVIVFARGGPVMIHVNGCFWHACTAHYRAPKNPRASWGHDLAAEERARVARRAAVPGRHVVIWEHQLRDGSFAGVLRGLL